ncbi:MAG: anaerobic ribonucleoside-triphosphate reductase [Thermoprotei archaeon]|nr:MAG: anaerobic ribonucleoside-triphosphate reductase [Thermoprotei archaeon]RLF14764.1 MAG: anaerobic ribonucleoside-triphosphate reductase [Thermoprotei archaeon]
MTEGIEVWFKGIEHYAAGKPMVRTSDGYLTPWNREAIVKQLIRETKLAENFFGAPAISLEEAEEIAKEAESRILGMRAKFVSAPLIREIVNNILLERSEEKPVYAIYRNVLTRVGVPVYDAYLIDVGEGFEARENANLQPNPETSHKKKGDKVSKEEYLLLMNPRLADAHLKGDLHIHDLEYFGTRPFCQDWDLRYFFYYGLMPDGLGLKTSVAGPAKHVEVALLHSVKALASAQTNFAGGQGFYNYTVFMAPYLRGLSYKHIKQLAQMMFYELTQIYVARGGQMVFSNIQITPGVPDLWKDKPVVAMGKVGPDVYGDYEDEVRAFFRAIYEVALEGDWWGKPFNFPKLEGGITPEFFKPEYDEEWLLAHNVVSKFGTPYFDNMLPAYRGYGKGVSCYQCCAYVFTETPETDPDFNAKLYFEDGKHFSMGGMQVVTLNLPRAAYRAAGDDDRLFEEIAKLMDAAVEIFQIKKRWMELAVKSGRLPFAVQRPKDPKTGQRGPPAVDLDNLVYTIGVVGGNEMVQWHTGFQLHESRDAVKLLVKTLLEMRKYKAELEEKIGMRLAIARTPAESCAQRLAVADMLSPEFKDMAITVVKGDLEEARRLMAEGVRDVPLYYTNGTHVYVGAQIPLTERISIEQKFWPILSGGNIFHIWLGEAYPDPEALFKVTKRIATQTQIGYFAYTKDLTICEQCFEVSAGINDACPNCGSTNVRYWSRVTGYYQEVGGWNEAKKRELKDRYRTRISI